MKARAWGMAALVASASIVAGTIAATGLGSSRAEAESAVTPATFQAAIASARSGQTLRLGPGWYGDLVIRGQTFSPPLRLIADKSASPPTFNTITVRRSQGIALEGLAIELRPGDATLEHTPVLDLDACEHVTFANGRIRGGLAVNGVPEDAPKLDRTGNVLGRPTGRVNISKCSNVTIENSEISNLGRGIVLNEPNHVTIRGNNIHGLRRTAILGAGSDILVENNQIHDFNPWRWGETPVGDHADFIAFWAPPKVAPLRNVRVIGNRLDAGAGTPVLGMWFVDYENVEVRDNVLTGTDHQGIMTTNVRGVTITKNTLNGRALIILREGTKDALVSDNLTKQVWDKTNGADNNRVLRNRPAKESTEEAVEVLSGTEF